MPDSGLLIDPTASAEQRWLKKITLSGILQVIGFIFASGVFYSNLRAGQAETHRLLTSQADEIREIKASYVRSDLQTRREDTLVERLDSIKLRLDRIERKIDGRR